MKQLTIYSLSIVVAAIGLAACGKSTKGKMTNEWRMTSYEQNRFSSAGSNANQETMNMNETTYTENRVQTQNGAITSTYTSSGTVNNYVLTIKKDGTWFWSTDITRDGETRVTLDQTGTWSFIGKSKNSDFKKNERILFNILTKKHTMVEFNTSLSNTSYYTYLTGENTLIYTIAESKRKELVLELDNTMNVTNNNGDPNTDNTFQKITFKEK